MAITAKYTPPPTVTGSISLTLDETTAQKLRALLGACTSDHFSDLFRALDEALPNVGNLTLRLGRSPETQPLAADGAPTCISLGENYGAKFRKLFD